MMSESLHIGIAGGGLLGRLLAWQLARAGHRVAVFDRALNQHPVPRSQAPEPYVPSAAAFTAAGMLSPVAELDNAEPAVAALGWRSIALWRQTAAALGQPALVQCDGSLMLAHRGDEGSAQRVLGRLQAAMASADWRAASPPEGVQALDAAALRALEPAVQGPAHAWLLPGEGQLDSVAMMAALHAGAHGVDWHWATQVVGVDGGERGGTLRLADGRTLAFDVVVDVRGVGASPELPVRGVRGEVIWLRAPGHGLTRALRLLHPRHRVYVVPRSAEDVLVGATEIESEDRSPVSLRSAVELMAAAHSVLPALAEARILRMDVNLRPALPDNNPVIEHRGRLLRINGLFRHGWLLAPALVEQALRQTGWAGGFDVAINSGAASAGLAPATA